MNDITALRARLFDTLDALQDKESPMDIERAKAISEVAQTIINSAKVEVDYARVTGLPGGNFMGISPDEKAEPDGVTSTGKKTVKGNITVHRIRG